MGATDTPRIVAHFAKQQPDVRVFARFTPRAVNRPTVFATFEPKAWERAQNALTEAGLRAPIASALSKLEAGSPKVTLDQSLLMGIKSLLSPDNYVLPLKYLTGQVAAGIAYDYPFPTWTRHWLLTNRSANAAATATGGNLYYWFNLQSAGAKVLPQIYSTLVSLQSISESSVLQYLTLFADATATDQGWELRYEGRLEDVLASAAAGTGGSASPLSPSSAASPTTANTKATKKEKK